MPRSCCLLRGLDNNFRITVAACTVQCFSVHFVVIHFNIVHRSQWIPIDFDVKHFFLQPNFVVLFEIIAQINIFHVPRTVARRVWATLLATVQEMRTNGNINQAIVVIWFIEFIRLWLPIWIADLWDPAVVANAFLEKKNSTQTKNDLSIKIDVFAERKRKWNFGSPMAMKFTIWINAVTVSNSTNAASCKANLIWHTWCACHLDICIVCVL